MQNKIRLITEILFTIIILTLVGFGLFYFIYTIALFPLGMHDGMRVAIFGSTVAAVSLAGYKIRLLLRDYKKRP